MDYSFALRSMNRDINALMILINDAADFKPPWQYPSDQEEIVEYILCNEVRIDCTISALKECYKNVLNCNNNATVTLDKVTRAPEVNADEIENATVTRCKWDTFWKDNKVEVLLSNTDEVLLNLQQRRRELAMQKMLVKSRIHWELEKEEKKQVNVNLNCDNSLKTSSSSKESSIPKHWYKKEITIPTFDGKPEKWDQFWDIFEELVHKRNCSNIEKFSVLVDKCEGDAERHLRMIPRKSEFYHDAVKVLKDIYGNTKQSTLVLREQFKNIPVARDNGRSMRITLSDVMACIKPLRAKGETFGQAQMVDIIRKFPKSIREHM